MKKVWKRGGIGSTLGEAIQSHVTLATCARALEKAGMLPEG
jgi:hypothetical protein